jgi:hypothetical protein
MAAHNGYTAVLIDGTSQLNLGFVNEATSGTMRYNAAHRAVATTAATEYVRIVTAIKRWTAGHNDHGDAKQSDDGLTLCVSWDPSTEVGSIVSGSMGRIRDELTNVGYIVTMEDNGMEIKYKPTIRASMSAEDKRRLMIEQVTAAEAASQEQRSNSAYAIELGITKTTVPILMWASALCIISLGSVACGINGAIARHANGSVIITVVIIAVLAICWACFVRACKYRRKMAIDLLYSQMMMNYVLGIMVIHLAGAWTAIYRATCDWP